MIRMTPRKDACSASDVSTCENSCGEDDSEVTHIRYTVEEEASDDIGTCDVVAQANQEHSHAGG